MRRALCAGLLAGLALGTAPLAAAQYSENVLLGSWQHSDPGQYGGPPSTVRITFGQDGSYEGQFAVPSGVVLLHGHYRIDGDGIFRWVFDTAELCAAGSRCGPFPGDAGVLSLGQVHQCQYQLIGQGMLMVDGVRWYRAG